MAKLTAYIVTTVTAIVAALSVLPYGWAHDTAASLAAVLTVWGGSRALTGQLLTGSAITSGGSVNAGQYLRALRLMVRTTAARASARKAP